MTYQFIIVTSEALIATITVTLSLRMFFLDTLYLACCLAMAAPFDMQTAINEYAFGKGDQNRPEYVLKMC